MNKLRITLKDRKRFVCPAAMAAVLVLLAAGANALAVNNTVWTVSKASSNLTCSAPSHTTCNTISAAVSAALSGDIIVVGPGKYNESVTISTDSLSLFGAQAGRDPRGCRDGHDKESDARQCRDGHDNESIVDAGTTGNPAFSITVPYVVIDGFTIENGGGSFPAGIFMVGSDLESVSGLQVVNNIIKDNGVGVFLLYTLGNVVERNLIKDNNNPGTGTGAGYGVIAGISFASSINDNEFCGNQAAAITIDIAEFDVITNNTSENDGSFAIFVDTEGGVFKHNQGRNFGAKGVLPVSLNDTPVNADAAVDIGYGNQILEISDNDLEEGEGTISNGIAFTTIFGTSQDSEGVVIKDNTIKGFKCNGVVAEAASGQGMTRYSSLVANEIKENGQYGINIQAATTSNTNISFFDNEAVGNGVLDCNDDSVASGPSGYTLGTHDTWFNDIGKSSYPTGICTARGWEH
jgi:parallel beta-helix repeat protein